MSRTLLNIFERKIFTDYGCENGSDHSIKNIHDIDIFY